MKHLLSAFGLTIGFVLTVISIILTVYVSFWVIIATAVISIFLIIYNLIRLRARL